MLLTILSAAESADFLRQTLIDLILPISVIGVQFAAKLLGVTVKITFIVKHQIPALRNTNRTNPVRAAFPIMPALDESISNESTDYCHHT